MPNTDSKTYIVNEPPPSLPQIRRFNPLNAQTKFSSSYLGEVPKAVGVETLADIIQTGNTPLTIGVFDMWGSDKI